MKDECHDCQRPYGNENGFPDFIIPYWAWRRISPSGDINGLLCPSCICKRLHDAGITCEGAFMSGPIESVSRPLMQALRLVENLTEQGHGWTCPKCGERRQRECDRSSTG